MRAATPDLQRTALVRAARAVLAESGVEAGVLVQTDLALDVARCIAVDVAAAIERRTADAADVETLVEAMTDAVVEAIAPWREVLGFANLALERVVDFEAWSGIVAPWVQAVESSLLRARGRGFIRADVDPSATALVLRDALDRTAKASLLFGGDGYRGAVSALVRSALRA